jgi:hypothetical protein
MGRFPVQPSTPLGPDQVNVLLLFFFIWPIYDEIPNLCNQYQSGGSQEVLTTS